MKRLVYAALCTAALFYPVLASAGEVSHREWYQENRIFNGVKTGTLSPQEYRNLQRREASVAAQRYRDSHDGNGLQPQERERLNDRLNNLSRSIYTDKRN